MVEPVTWCQELSPAEVVGRKLWNITTVAHIDSASKCGEINSDKLASLEKQCELEILSSQEKVVQMN